MYEDKKATIYDIAEKAGVSISTVSRVFNGNAGVSGKTKKKVEKAMGELNYMPNALIRYLPVGAVKTIGLILQDITNPFYVETVSGIERVLNENGFTPMLGIAQYNPVKEGSMISEMLQRNVRGIIIAGSSLTGREMIFRTSRIVPLVMIQSGIRDLDCVNTEEERGAYEAVSYLSNLGHRNIAFVVYCYRLPSVSARMKGYLKAHHDNFLPVNRNYIVVTKHEQESPCNRIMSFLKAHPEVTAIFAYNDKIALEAYKAACLLGRKVPEDISIIGYDDIPLAAMIKPALTTVSQYGVNIGESAARLLVNKIFKNENLPARKVVLPTRLNVRDSAAHI